MLTGGAGGLAQLWEAGTNRPLGAPLRHPYSPVRAVAFSADGTKVATACIDQPEPGKGSVACTVGIWDASTGRRLTPWVRQRNYVVALAFSPDGKVLAAGTAPDWNRDPQARLWDVAAGGRLGEPMRHTSAVVFVAFSPDGKTVVTGSRDSTFRLWDAATGNPRGDPRTVTKGWRCGALSPAGDRLATAGGDGAARLWNTADGSPLPGAPLPHPREVGAVAVAFSPDGTLLVVGHEDGSAQLWDVASYKPLGPPVVQQGRLLGAEFAPDGQSFLTTAADGSPRVWPVPEPLAEPDLEQLALWLEVRTGLRLDEGQAVTRLTSEEWRQRRQQLTGKEDALPAWVTPPTGDRAWHDARARDAEQAGQSFTARWHLDRLIALRPNDGWLYARRGRTYTDEGRWELAKADYGRARQCGTEEEVLSWYRHRALICQARRQWLAALWYLDQLLGARPGEQDLQQHAEMQAQVGRAKE